jgi:cyclohexyl-isocyanide hydratase
MTQKPFRIVEVIYQGLTQLDFTAPHTVFSRLPHAETVVASLSGGEVVSDGGLVFARTRPLAEVDGCDLLFLPGGRTTVEVINDPTFMAHVIRLGAQARYLTSVCTGSLILGAAGFLQGKRAACHWAWRDMLPLFQALPDAARVVRDGNIITGGGVTAGIDFALVVAKELAGDSFAEELQLTLEYAPEPPFDCGRPDEARPEVLASVRHRMKDLLAQQRMRAQTAAEEFRR